MTGRGGGARGQCPLFAGVRGRRLDLGSYLGWRCRFSCWTVFRINHKRPFFNRCAAFILFSCEKKTQNIFDGPARFLCVALSEYSRHWKTFSEIKLFIFSSVLNFPHSRSCQKNLLSCHCHSFSFSVFCSLRCSPGYALSETDSSAFHHQRVYSKD